MFHLTSRRPPEVAIETVTMTTINLRQPDEVHLSVLKYSFPPVVTRGRWPVWEPVWLWLSGSASGASSPAAAPARCRCRATRRLRFTPRSLTSLWGTRADGTITFVFLPVLSRVNHRSVLQPTVWAEPLLFVVLHVVQRLRLRHGHSHRPGRQLPHRRANPHPALYNLQYIIILSNV